jgi:hypothetical protein
MEPGEMPASTDHSCGASSTFFIGGPYAVTVTMG